MGETFVFVIIQLDSTTGPTMGVGQIPSLFLKTTTWLLYETTNTKKNSKNRIQIEESV